jgi:hypothetical protein
MCTEACVLLRTGVNWVVSLLRFIGQAMRDKAITNQGCTKDISVNFLPRSSVLNGKGEVPLTKTWKYVGNDGDKAPRIPKLESNLVNGRSHGPSSVLQRKEQKTSKVNHRVSLDMIKRKVRTALVNELRSSSYFQQLYWLRYATAFTSLWNAR